jgi:hypothetical protein
MKLSLEINDLARNELAALEEYRKVIADESSDSSRFATEFYDLQNEREAPYSCYQELTELTDW